MKSKNEWLKQLFSVLQFCQYKWILLARPVRCLRWSNTLSLGDATMGWIRKNWLRIRSKKENWISVLEPFYSEEEHPCMHDHIVDINDYFD